MRIPRRTSSLSGETGALKVFVEARTGKASTVGAPPGRLNIETICLATIAVRPIYFCSTLSQSLSFKRLYPTPCLLHYKETNAIPSSFESVTDFSRVQFFSVLDSVIIIESNDDLNSVALSGI